MQNQGTLRGLGHLLLPHLHKRWGQQISQADRSADSQKVKLQSHQGNYFPSPFQEAPGDAGEGGRRESPAARPSASSSSSYQNVLIFQSHRHLATTTTKEPSRAHPGALPPPRGLVQPRTAAAEQDGTWGQGQQPRQQEEARFPRLRSSQRPSSYTPGLAMNLPPTPALRLTR